MKIQTKKIIFVNNTGRYLQMKLFILQSGKKLPFRFSHGRKNLLRKLFKYRKPNNKTVMHDETQLKYVQVYLVG